jgi:4-hydroxyproline epimerase
MPRIAIIDSHTGGEPTRTVLEGGPDLGHGPLSERVRLFREKFDRYRAAIVREPRGSDVLVGALLCEPTDPACAAGVIFFNNVGYLGMCGHGAIGVVATLARHRRLPPGRHKLETPVGIVTATLHPDGRISVTNVPSHRHTKTLVVEVPNPEGAWGQNKPTFGVTGDLAYGGNWFFLVQDHGQSLELRHASSLTEFTWRLRQAVNAAGYPEVDHVELFAPPVASGAHARNFVLCPGQVYDRSPCGTGTSAKLACLAADGKLAEGETWVQESFIGSLFEGRYRWLDRERGIIEPTITGTAHVTAESTLILDDADPFCWGIG